jgi:hypothetical protein
LEPEVVLDWFDGPRIFTLREKGIHYLAYSSEETPTAHRYLIVPTDDKTIADLRRGAMTIYEALRSAVVWIVDAGQDAPLTITQINWAQVPPAVIPAKDVLLTPDLEPLLRVYVRGDLLTGDAVPASVLKKYVDGASLLMQKLYQSAQDKGLDVAKSMFDPPVQRVAFNSLEISYAAPPRELIEKTGLPAVINTFDDVARNANPESDPRLLEAIVKMCPFQSGPVESVTLSGLLTAGSSFELRRGDRPTWREKLAAVRESQPVHSVEIYGRIGELDWDKGTFLLREVDGSQEERNCRTDEPIISELLEIFGTGQAWVRVFGKQLQGASFVEVERYEQQPPPQQPLLGAAQ